MREISWVEIGFLANTIWRAVKFGARSTPLPGLYNKYSGLCGDCSANLFTDEAVMKQNARLGKEAYTMSTYLLSTTFNETNWPSS